ncbi:MAG: aminotransferase class I/II-fold pyridoxal phosphate-dependent enzyme [Myxococcales bacterium]|nr:aminotransferase class I/II-fold pyridoxal phosphate-dependent enzyme [Myxococcota bacterium]MDW8282059.1 aminotransferase class I/II-fold pyridoxal phosphate-dependent enzyme [Myxococcales bacterium]
MPQGLVADAAAQAGLSRMALGLVGSEILKIAAEIRHMVERGRQVCNLTVGDFAPAQFPIPRALQEAIHRAYERRETNYPPSDGVLMVRESVRDFYRRELGLDHPLAGIVVTGGARPAIYATFRAVVEPGERVIYPTPSWNNNHYCHLTQATPVELPTTAGEWFMPTADKLRPLLPGARLLCLNSPLNPTGTVLGRDELVRICELVVQENRRRQHTGERLLYVMYDQVYWMLTFGGTRHHTPVELVPEMAAYTIFVDGVSKSLAATGLRVGWTVAPPYVAARMRDILGHVGAWAPRPEQVAVGEVLADREALGAYHREMTSQVQLRLGLLYDGILQLRASGLQVDAIAPQGAIYLSVQVPIHGRRLPAEHGGDEVRTNEQIRRYLLDAAGAAVVPFQAFGMRDETGWMRLSVGAVSPEEIRAMLPRLEAALRALA